MKDLLRNQLEADFEKRIALAEGAGLVRVDLPSLLHLTIGVYLFTWKESEGVGGRPGSWALCVTPGMNFNMSPGSLWAAVSEWSRGEFGFDDIGNHHPIQLRKPSPD